MQLTSKKMSLISHEKNFLSIGVSQNIYILFTTIINVIILDCITSCGFYDFLISGTTNKIIF